MYSAPIFYIMPLFIVLWIYCVYDIVTHKYQNDRDKLIYLLLVIVVPVIGIPLYLIFWRTKKTGNLNKSIF
ncbi:PLD nuclease N-terminal domain-containing protein [Nonlabens sp. YIK11]|uniref:PLDc N-terminal domain-containing protein n=1 Tax=Nonlabens sp. YIK11 TaxID=1453349 RepID=UPI0009E91E61